MQNTTRRAILAGLAAAPVAGLPALAAGEELPALIAAYSQARASANTTGGEMDDIEEKWNSLRRDLFLIPCLLGGAIEARFGVVECREWIADNYSRGRESLKPMARIAPELAEEMRRALDAKEAENLALADKLFAEEEERKEAFGLGPAVRRYQEAADAEEEAALALCSYQCRNIEEARIKAAAILEGPLGDEFEPHLATACLRSFVPQVNS